MRRSVPDIIKRLISLIDSLLPVMLLTIAAGAAGYLCAIFIPVLGGAAILESLEPEGAELSLGYIFAAIAACAALRGILHYIEQLSGHYIAFKILAVLRDKVFKALRRLSPAKLEGKDKGNLVSLMTSDIELLEVFYAHTVAPAAIAVIVSASMVVFIGSYHVVFGIISLAAYIAVGAVIPALNSGAGRGKAARYREIFGSVSSSYLESLRGMKEDIQYNWGYKRMAGIEDMTGELDEKQKELKKHEGLTKAVTDSSVYMFSIGLLFAGIYMMQKGLIGFEKILIPVIAMFSSFGPAIALSRLSDSLVQTFAAADRILDILDETPPISEVKNGRDVKSGEAEFEYVSFAYDDEEILKNVNFAAEENTITGITGRSGSGKSTLLKLLMRFWDPDKGKIKISDENIKNINTKSLRDAESYMTQETFLFNGTIEENIRIGKLDAGMDEVIHAARQASVHEFIMSLPNGYATNAGELGDRLSGGEKQRIGLARAFIHDSKLMILDEPTSNLDSLNEAVILKSLKENPDGRTVILVSHRKSALRIADEVYELKIGRIS